MLFQSEEELFRVNLTWSDPETWNSGV